MKAKIQNSGETIPNKLCISKNRHEANTRYWYFEMKTHEETG